MMRKLLALALAAASLSVIAADAPKPHRDPLRGATPIPDKTSPAPIAATENKDLKRVRSYAMQPPTIPHAIDNYQVDRFANRCMTCHARTRAGESQATPISITHYTDREGNFLADVSPRRYFCDTCHVVQMEAKPLVENTFEDVESLVKRKQPQARASPAAKKK
jgi:nitrate reductase (cytochrome), electron transfer subunit